MMYGGNERAELVVLGFHDDTKVLTMNAGEAIMGRLNVSLKGDFLKYTFMNESLL